MFDEKYEVHPEIAKEFPQPAPGLTQEQIEEVQQEVQQAVEKAEQIKEDFLPQAKDFKELREAKKRIEKENAELRRRYQELEITKQRPQEVDEPLNLKPTELVEGKHLYKYDKKFKQQEEQIKQYHQQTMQMLAETRLKTLYPDFDKVVSEDNILKLKEQFPELAATLGSASDSYSANVSAYTMIKKLNLAPEDNYQQDRERVQKNLAKPRSTQAISPHQSESPLTQVNAFASGLTDELKKQLHKEMMDAIKAPR